MINKNLIIKNKLGMHARPASLLVQTASRFQSDIFIIKNENRVNAKSILGIMMLAAGYGTQLEVIIDGADEVQAMDALEDLFNRRFEEE